MLVGTIKATTNYRLEISPDNQVMALRFIGNVPPEAYKELWNESLELAIEHDVQRFIMDQSKVGRVSFSTRSWVVKNMFPQLKVKLKGKVHIAVIPSENPAPMVGLQFLARATANLSAGYVMDYFSSDKKCLEWLTKAKV